MARYSKGLETKKLILKTARRLFYEQGYEMTTTRQIADVSDTNLGLIKYYFESKADIALIIYLDIKQALDSFLSQANYNSTENFLISSGAELALCFNSPNFERFYNEIYKEYKLRLYFQNTLIRVLDSTGAAHTKDYSIFASLAVSSLKPALVTYHSLADSEHFSADEYLRFYMQQQIHYLGFEEPEQLCEHCMQEIKKYYFNVVDNFTPVNAIISD